jgi:hypothetical protein
MTDDDMVFTSREGSQRDATTTMNGDTISFIFFLNAAIVETRRSEGKEGKKKDHIWSDAALKT